MAVAVVVAVDVAVVVGLWLWLSFATLLSWWWVFGVVVAGAHRAMRTRYCVLRMCTATSCCSCEIPGVRRSGTANGATRTLGVGPV